MDVDALFERVYPALFRYLNRLTGDADEADEIAQEAFVRLLDEDLPEAEARPWLFTVAVNLVRDRARTESRRRELLTAMPVRPSTPPRPDEAAGRGERIEAVRAALDELRARDRKILLMREEGFSYKEIARAIDVAPSSVGTLLARALRRFQDVYFAAEDDDASRE